MTRLLYVVSHPIQYQAPLLRLIAAQPDIALTVLFERIPAGEVDPGFGMPVTWDIPLLEGYRSERLTPLSLVRSLWDNDVVWIHGWQGWRRKLVLLAAKLCTRPVLMRGENWLGAMPDPPGWKGVLKRVYLRTIFGLCAGFLAIGRGNGDYYARLGVAAGRIFAMPYAIDNELFSRMAGVDPKATRRRLGLPADRAIVLFAGKLMRRKHPHTLLAAWRRAFPDPQARPLLVFVGDGEMSAELRSAGADVHCLGFRNQSEMPALYAMADIFVLAAEREAWGLAINEAMACGTAVIASSACGATDDLVDASVGAVVRPADVEDLAAALRRVLPEASALGAAAQWRVAAWDFAADLRGLRQAVAAVARRDRPS